MVERRHMCPSNANDFRTLTLSAQAGLHFLHMLDQQLPTKTYRAAFITRFALQPLPAPFAGATDEATRRFVQTMVGRVPDARQLARAFAGDGAAHVAQEHCHENRVGSQRSIG
jgi:hypothetical protein